MAKNRFLVRSEFRRFLADNPDELVGITRDAVDCPIATYLTEMTHRTWHVSPLGCVPQDDGMYDDEFRPPRWAREFIHRLDRHFRTSREVVGSQALYILSEVTA